MKKAIVLLSGGLDSATVLAIAQRAGFAVYALSFSYGQRHKVELNFARKLARKFKIVEHKIAKIDLRIFGGSALTAEIAVPKDRDLALQNIPVTYVPARNTIFLSYALAYAEVVGASNIFIGVNAVDYSGYPDCRPEFISAFEKLASLATAASATGSSAVTIHAPLIKLSKKEIIETGIALGLDYSSTHSCYDPIIVGKKVLACGKCDSCQLRLAGFREAGIVDPSDYVSA
jgi:7-cyano-7-deazaguanine synthase